MTCSCPTGDGSLSWPCQTHPPESPRLLTPLEAEAVLSIRQLEAQAHRLGKVLGSMADVDQHAVERAMIALHRATAQMESAVTRNEVKNDPA